MAKLLPRIIRSPGYVLRFKNFGSRAVQVPVLEVYISKESYDVIECTCSASSPLPCQAGPVLRVRKTFPLTSNLAYYAHSQ
jgi:hypothetical protein